MLSRFADRRIIASQAGFASVPVGVLPGPDSVPGLALWLKADAIVGFADGQNLTSWISSEGQAYNFQKPSYVTGYPTYQTNVVNGLPVVRHVGSGGANKRLNCVNSAFWLTTPTLFVVMAWKTATPGLSRRGPGIRVAANQGFGIVRTPGAAEYNVALVGLDPGGVYGVGQHGVGQPEPPAEAENVFHIAELARVTGSGWGYWTNGVQSGGFSADVPLVQGVDDDPFSTCLYYDTGGGVTDGLTREDIDVAEIIMYNGAVSVVNRAVVRAYAASRYAISAV